MLKKDIINKIGLRTNCAIEQARIIIPPHTSMVPSIIIRRIKDEPMSTLEDTLSTEDDNLLTQTALTEGNHYETENRYTVFLYAKTPADIYESLIAVLEVK